jgi:hypothetical protein
MWAKFQMNAVYPDRHYLPAKVRSFLDFLVGPKGFTIEPVASDVI